MNPLPFGGGSVLIDKSAYARIASVPSIKTTWSAGVAQGKIYLATPTFLELLDSAQSSRDYVEMADELGALPAAPVDEAIFESAVSAHAQLAQVNSSFQRNFSLQDLLVAAAADHYGLGVWHYDRDFDLIVEHSALAYASIWASPAGSIGATSRRTPERAARSSLNKAVGALPESAVVEVVDGLLNTVEERLREEDIVVPARVTSD